MLKDHSTELRDEQLSDLRIEWFYDRATLKDGEGRRIAVFKDSAKANQFDEIARRANSYPRLVEVLRKILAGEFGNVSLEAMERAGGGSYWTSAAALLRELGEIE